MSKDNDDHVPENGEDQRKGRGISKPKRFMIGVTTTAGSASGLATAGWLIVHYGQTPLVWALGAAGAAVYSGAVFGVEKYMFKHERSKAAMDGLWDLAASVLIPPVVFLLPYFA